MSAACAQDAAPNITAASRNLRIEYSHRTPELGADHRSLTLTNRCRGKARVKQNGAGTSRAVNKD
jgi:hypothetical protein